MGLDAVIRAGLAVAKTVTVDLRDTVTHEAWASVDGFGTPTYAASVSRTALVERRQKLLRTHTGEEVLSTHRVLFVEPLSLDLRDRLTLSDGTTGRILAAEGVMDPSTDVPYALEVWMGEGWRRG